jgi:hypothetical protein
MRGQGKDRQRRSGLIGALPALLPNSRIFKKFARRSDRNEIRHGRRLKGSISLSALFSCVVEDAFVSLQFSILKVLAGQPDGRAIVPDLNRYISLLSCPEWTARMKRLSARAPDLDIFGSRYVLRDDAGWQLTEDGYVFLASIESPARAAIDQDSAAVEVILTAAPARSPSPPILRLVADNQDASRRGRAKISTTTAARVA